MSRVLVTQTRFTPNRQTFFWVSMPEVREPGFYRAAVSFNAFFNSMRNPKANVTEVRQFTADLEDDAAVRMKFRPDVGWDQLRTFASIWEFYRFVGYDHRRRRYNSGERMKWWDGRRFVLPGRCKEAGNGEG